MKCLSSLCVACLVLVAASLPASAQVVISEFLAANGGVLLDQDGDSSDWIELYNSGAVTVSLGGWHLTDDAADLAKWTFPATNLAPGRFLVVFASAKNRAIAGAQLHTNFELDSAGEYLALVRPDGITVEFAFAPAFPPQEQDVSYGSVLATASATFIAAGKAMKWRVPAGAVEMPVDWASTNFDDSAWMSGQIALGFDAGQVDGGGGGGPTTNVARGGAALQSSTLSTFTANLAVDGNTANFTHTAADQNLPATWEVNLGANVPIERIVLYNRSDCCGSRLRDVTVRILSLDGATTHFTSALLNPENTLGGGGLNGPATLSLTNLPGGAVVGGRVRVTRTPDPDLSGTGGQGNADEANVLSLGEVEVYGSAAPGSFDSVVRTDVETAMRAVNASALVRIPFLFDPEETPPIDSFTLRMKYDDGFIAYLNGTEIVRRNAAGSPAWNSAATAEHADLEALQFEEIDVSPFQSLLQAGVNVLAIQGLNLAAGDDDFLLLPELMVSSLQTTVNRYFPAPTPGATNSTAYLGLVADTKFSVDRGFFDVPFTVAITTATVGAEIRYTTTGSAPGVGNGVLYTGPIHIGRTTVLRAIATKTGWTPSNVDTHSYIFLSNVVAQSQAAVIGAGYPATWAGVNADYAMDPRITGTNASQMNPSLRSLPSLFISTSISNLFDPIRGICAQPTSHGVAWERPASIEMVDTNGATEFQEEAGLRIQGGYFRDANVTQKHSLRVLFKGL